MFTRQCARRVARCPWPVCGRDYHVPDVPAEQIDVIHCALADISGGQIALGDADADIDRCYEGDSWEPGSLRGLDVSGVGNASPRIFDVDWGGIASVGTGGAIGGEMCLRESTTCG